VSGLEKKRARISAGEMAFVDEGDPESPAIVFLHGFPASSYLWREFVPLFAPWMHVVAPDLLGAGDSEKPAGAGLHIRAQARYVRELLATLGVEGFAVVGHSSGGGVAQLLAIEGGVEAMVLIDSVAFEAWPDETVRELWSTPPERATAGFVETFVRTALARGMGRPSRLGDAALVEYLRPYAGVDGVAAFFRMAHALDGIGLDGSEAALARLTVPTLILWGEDDPLVSVEVAERLNEAIATSALALLPGCSHFLPEDAPETIAPLMFDYLRSRYLGRPHEHEHEHADPGTVLIQLERRRPEDRR